MDWFALAIIAVILLDAFDFIFDPHGWERRAYKRTSEDLNWNRKK